MAKRRKQPGRKPIDKNANDDVFAFLAEEGMEKVRKYLREGRHFAALADDVLKSQWISTFKVMAADPTDYAIRKNHNDIEAEMVARKIDPPYAEVDVEAFIRATMKALEGLKSDPERYAKLNEDLASDLETTRHRRKTSTKN